MTQPVDSTTHPRGSSPDLVLAGRYRVGQRLGSGGMASVHRGVDERLDREVAVKLLHPHLADDEVVRDRFHREATAAARVSRHDGVVTILDHSRGEDHDGDPTPYLVMELVEGGSVADVLTVRGGLSPGQVLALLRPAITGLAAAHDQGMVHRDVTPANILVTRDGASKLADFGLARVAAASTATFHDRAVGSPHYMAPEAVRNETLDARADVYSLGCVLYHCLTGQPPFGGESPEAIAYNHGTTPVPPPSAVNASARPLDALVARATAPERENRFEDARALLAALDEAVPGGPEEIDLRDGVTDLIVPRSHATASLADVPPPPTTAVEPRSRRGRRWRLALVGFLVGALLTVGGWLVFDQLVAPWTPIPDVGGQLVSEARATLEDEGFRVRTADERVFSREVREGAVVSQSPVDEARRRSTVTLTVSMGPRTGELPALVGRTTAAATTAIDELALDIEVVVEQGFDDEVPPGTVLAASPASGATITEGSTVTLTVSAGPAPVEVPDVTGEGQASATATLVSLGLTASVVEQAFSDQVPEGAVIETRPAVGSELRRGDEVGLVVSRGPQPVEVPDVTGAREAEAISQLESLGLVVEVRDVPTILGIGRGFVDAQEPSAGTVRPRGSTVRIFVWR